MRHLKLIWIFIVIIFASCNDSEDACRYILDYIPRDTTLYISYEIDGQEYKYYQGEMDGGRVYDPIEYNETQFLHFYPEIIGFGHLYADTIIAYLFPHIDLTFWNKSIQDKSVPFYSGYNTKLSNSLESSYFYTYPPEEPTINDTIFMHGISVSIEFSYSTENVMKYFDYNIDSISEFFSEKSYFNISSIEPVCNDYFLIKGVFSTKIMYKNRPFDIKSIDNGEFTFIVK